MLNLLVLDYDFSYSYYKNSFYLWDEVKKLTHCCVLTTTDYMPRTDINEIIGLCPFKPDFILINEFINDHHNWKMTGLESINIPIGYMPHDVDAFVEIRREYLHKNKVSLIFPLYRSSFLRLYPEYASRVRWLPHHVNTEVFKDYNLKKGIDGLLFGRVSQPYYQLRQKIVARMNGQPGFVYLQNIADQPGTPVLPVEEYPRLINQAKTFFTCCSTRQYALLKYFEVLACSTLLLADTCADLTELGFEPDVHFVEINETNFYEKYLYYVNNSAERNRIAANGYHFVRNRHSTTIRAQQLVHYIQAL